MSTIPSKQDLHSALEGFESTSGWDVLVSYEEKHLNKALAQKWTEKKKGFDVKFHTDEDPTHDLHVHRDFTVTLDPPELKFNTEIKQATLKMMLNGSVLAITTYKGKQLDPEKTPIPTDAYYVEVTLPLAAISGDGEVHKGSDVVHFDDKEKDYSLIFHFKNASATWHVKKTSPDKKETDKVLQDAVQAITTWFTDQSNYSWIDISLTKLTNQPNPDTDYDTLRPKSFKVSCQEGYLMVFIATLSQPGRPDPIFNHRGTSTMAPVSTGFTTSIIISHKIFQEFVCKELKRNYTGKLVSITEEAVGSGMKLSLAMTDNQSWDLDIPTGREKYSVGKCAVDYTNSPIKLHIVDDSSSPFSNAALSWEAETKVTWHKEDAVIPPDYRWGRTKITSKWTNPSKVFAHFSGGELQMGIDVSQTELPSMSFDGEDVGDDGMYIGSTNVPNFFKEQVRFKLPSNLSCQFRGLSFFAAQNVFVPGVEFVKATEQMLPHDVVLLGKMPEITEKRGLLRALATAHTPSAPISKFLDDVYEDNYFFADLMQCILKGDPEGVWLLIHGKGFDFKADELTPVLVELMKPGPNFDLRYAGGAYKISDAAELGYKEIFVHSRLRTIYVDGELVKSQKQSTDGSITFVSGNGQQSFQVVFTGNSDVEHPAGGESFSGTTWPTASPDQKAPIHGQRYFPWGDASRPGPPSPSDSTRDAEGFKYLCVALDLMKATKDDVPSGGFQNEVPTWVPIVGIAVAIIWNLINALKEWKTHGESWKEGYQRVRKAVDKQYDSSIKYTFKIPSVEKMKEEFSSRAEEILNREINKGIIKKDELESAAKPEILKYAEKWLLAESAFKIKKEYNAIVSLDAEHGLSALSQLVSAQTSQIFNDPNYDPYLGALTDTALTVHEKDVAIRDRRAIEKRISKLMVDIETADGNKKTLIQEREAKREQAIKEKWTEERREKMETEYQDGIERIDRDLTRKDEELGEERKRKTETIGQVDKLEEEEKEAREKEEKKAKEFWKDK